MPVIVGASQVNCPVASSILKKLDEKYTIARSEISRDMLFNWFLKGGFVHGFKLIQLLSKSKKSDLNLIEIIKETNKYIRDFDLIMCISGNKSEYETKFNAFDQEQLNNGHFRREGQNISVYRYIDRYLTKDNESFIEFEI
jgi:hypothetical protein